MITMLIVGLAIILIIAVYLYKKKPPKVPASPISQAEKPDPIRSLVKLNLDLRKAFIDEDSCNAAERVIDKLVELLPVVAKTDSVSGELAWTVNRISAEYLPNKCIYPFLQLDKDKQAEASVIDSFKSSLTSLNQELDDIASLLSNKDEAEFTKKAKFLKHKFNTDGEI
ncbi:MAG: hypothetical protein RPR40_02865 [Bermanella sp.]